MSLRSRLLTRVFGLPPAETYAIGVDKNLPITLPDGVVLLADHYYPRDRGPRPTVLTRSTYTDRSKGGWVSELYAERGFHVLVVSGRGVDGSSGELVPFRSERDDGVVVLAWLKGQLWFNGVLGTTGASYLGYTQWAIAGNVGPLLTAMSSQLIGSNMRELIYPGGGLALETFVWWMSMVDAQELPVWSYLLRLASGGQRRRAALRRLPLGTLDQAIIGKPSPFWREWIAHEQPDDPWWAPGDHSAIIGAVFGPVSAELWLRSSHAHSDVFVRICDVEPSGRSLNICDGLLRLAPGRPVAEADGCRRVCVELWPTAYRVRRGHRLRVQIAGGSFPRWSRNLSSGEPSATATTAQRVEHSVYHDPHHPSSIVLPIAT